MTVRVAFASPKTGMPPKLGIVAGGGALPGYLARVAREQGREIFILAIEDHAEPEIVERFPHTWIRMGGIGKAIAACRDNGIEQIVMAGPVSRPSLGQLRPDGRALKFLAKGAFKKGDDGLLSAIVQVLEQEEGFRVLAVQDIAKGILARAGVLGRTQPTERDLEDIQRGIAVLTALGAADVGQAVVVQDGLVLGVEAVEGTDALIERASGLRREGRGPTLVKMPKPGQEHRVDLPTVGPDTVEACARGGFAGIAVEAGMCLLLHESRVVEAADAAGMFVLARRADDR
jgi:DUF1009 family protein